MYVAPSLAALRERVRTAGAAPLLTHYDLGTGARTELSGTTFANWVAKTANLIEEVGADSGQVALLLAERRPAHWMTLIWPLAAWSRDAMVSLEQGDDDLVVLGPDDPHPVLPGATFACSLHPLGVGLRDLPDGVLDFTTEALAQPDDAATLPSDPNAPAWLAEGRVLSVAEVHDVAPVGGRVLVRPDGALASLQRALIAPLLGGGSAVIVEGPADDSRLAELRRTERCVE